MYFDILARILAILNLQIIKKIHINWRHLNLIKKKIVLLLKFRIKLKRDHRKNKNNCNHLRLILLIIHLMMINTKIKNNL